MISFFSGILLLVNFHRTAFAQEPPTKIRVSNSALSVTALPLVAAREWNFFREQGLQAEIIMMNPAISNPAIAAGEIDYVAASAPVPWQPLWRDCRCERCGFLPIGYPIL
jgi:ABC-type nitrate/sulfonate/bicarbonate transport system substrate-binding protein